MSPNFSAWLNNLLPKKGASVKDELHCYALPYGGLGFVSHVLTYWTIALVSYGRSPLTTRKNKYWKFDIILAVFGLLFSFPLSIFTIIRCRQRWDFVLLGIWKATMSLTLGLISSHAALQVRNKEKKEQVLWWLVLYVPGFLVGAIGLGNLINEDWDAWMGKKGINIFTSFLLAATLTMGVLSSGIGQEFVRRRRERHVPAPKVSGTLSRIPPEHLFTSPEENKRAPMDFSSSLDTRSLQPNSRLRGVTHQIQGWQAYIILGGLLSIILDGLLRILFIHSVFQRRNKTNYSPLSIHCSTVPQEDDIELADRIPTTTSYPSAEPLANPQEEVPKLVPKPEEPSLGDSILKRIANLDAIGDGLAYLLTILTIGPMSMLSVVGVLFAFYSDFAIGAMAGNMAGVPSSDNAVLYWVYFFAKRFPLFSF